MAEVVPRYSTTTAATTTKEGTAVRAARTVKTWSIASTPNGPVTPSRRKVLGIVEATPRLSLVNGRTTSALTDAEPYSIPLALAVPEVGKCKTSLNASVPFPDAAEDNAAPRSPCHVSLMLSGTETGSTSWNCR